MGAELLAPFAMWGTIGLVVLIVAFFIYGLIKSGAVAENERNKIVDTVKETNEALEKLKTAVAGGRANFDDARNSLPNSEDSNISSPTD